MDDPIARILEVLEAQQKEISYWKSVTVAVMLVLKGECEKVSDPEEMRAILDGISERMMATQLTDAELELVRESVARLLSPP